MELQAHVDAAGDGWLWLYSPSEGPTLAGLWLELGICPSFPRRGPPASSRCEELLVFGASGGAAEAAGWVVSAGYAFSHGVYASCLAQPCAPVATDGALLTRLSVALPTVAVGVIVCITQATLFAHNGTEVSHPKPSCAPQLSRPPPLQQSYNTSPPARGVAFVKTYKTGSSTLGSVFHRYADSRGLDVAMNAKALRWSRSLETRLQKGTMPKPNEWCDL